jgi:hypothetical protein
MIETESKPTAEGQQAAAEAIKKIHQRSYAERNNLGKMIKCQVCKLRHRQPRCKEKYV